MLDELVERLIAMGVDNISLNAMPSAMAQDRYFISVTGRALSVSGKDARLIHDWAQGHGGGRGSFWTTPDADLLMVLTFMIHVSEVAVIIANAEGWGLEVKHG